MRNRVVEVDPRADPLWLQLVTDWPSQLFHSPAWLGVLSDTYGFPIKARVVVDAGGEPRAGLVFAEIHDHMDPRVVSLPFSDFCDPIVSSWTEWAMLTEGLVEETRRFQLKCIDSRIPGQDDRLVRTGTRAWHAVDTNRDPDSIWSDFDGSARRSIRKAHACGVVVRPAESIDDLRAFFDLHLRIRKHKYGLLAQPFAFFESIWARLIDPGAGRLLLATVEAEVIGGVMYLEWKDTLYYKFNASDPARLSIRPNDAVLWSGINEAHRRGSSWLDFGVSDLDQEGLLRYKRKYASREGTVVVWRSAAEPSRRERVARQVLTDLTELLVRDDIPDDRTEAAGNILYRYFT